MTESERCTVPEMIITPEVPSEQQQLKLPTKKKKKHRLTFMMENKLQLVEKEYRDRDGRVIKSGPSKNHREQDVDPQIEIE